MNQLEKLIMKKIDERQNLESDFNSDLQFGTSEKRLKQRGKGENVEFNPNKDAPRE